MKLITQMVTFGQAIYECISNNNGIHVLANPKEK